MTMHDDEVRVDEATVRALLAAQCPHWVDLPLSPAGAGTDNVMFRLGEHLLVRLPRTPGTSRAIAKEQQWLPRLAPHLTCRVPEPVHIGTPATAFALPWSVYRWIDGQEPRAGAVQDWAGFGRDLAAFVRELHAVDLMGATREGDLSWYRGGSLRDCDPWFGAALDGCRRTVGGELDLPALERLWRAGSEVPEPAGPHVWLHGDLKPSNLLVHDGALHAVLDFGGLGVGLPDAEHAPLWDLPAEARHAYRQALELDDATWARARGWAILVGVSGIAYYWDTYPAFVAECRARLDAIVADA